MNILIMTATLAPPAGMPDLLRTDPSVRLDDYKSALRFYSSLLGSVLDGIVFVDNSNSDLSELKEAIRGHENRVEFISFNGMDHPPVYGRGYAEFKLLDHAMDNARSVQAAPPHTRFWKVTGRYRVLNLPDIIRRAPRSFAVYVDLRRYPVPWLDTRIMAWTHDGYRDVFRGIYKNLREDLHRAPAEQHLFAELYTLRNCNGVVPRFTVVPKVKGIRGYDNRDYHSGLNLVKYYIRLVLRRLAPALWV